ncbi:hypothetical protein [Senegalia massiliensis]|jgi:hypothetical protein|nr:hypothetical protein [Senegalia massiliensis]
MDFNIEFKLIFALIILIIGASIQYTLNKILFELKRIRNYLSGINDD